tara:strand:+ start:281 stop:517 length:237 start_codon:yes stop_codon:yes gene_type:complete
MATATILGHNEKGETTMPKPSTNWDEFAALAADAAGIELPEAIRPQIVGHFSILADHAARIMAIEIDDDIEPAPVFRP